MNDGIRPMRGAHAFVYLCVGFAAASGLGVVVHATGLEESQCLGFVDHVNNGTLDNCNESTWIVCDEHSDCPGGQWCILVDFQTFMDSLLDVTYCTGAPGCDYQDAGLRVENDGETTSFKVRYHSYFENPGNHITCSNASEVESDCTQANRCECCVDQTTTVGPGAEVDKHCALPTCQEGGICDNTQCSPPEWSTNLKAGSLLVEISGIKCSSAGSWTYFSAVPWTGTPTSASCASW